MARLGLQPEWTGCSAGNTGRVCRWVRPTRESLCCNGRCNQAQPLGFSPLQRQPVNFIRGRYRANKQISIRLYGACPDSLKKCIQKSQCLHQQVLERGGVRRMVRKIEDLEGRESSRGGEGAGVTSRDGIKTWKCNLRVRHEGRN